MSTTQVLTPPDAERQKRAPSTTTPATASSESALTDATRTGDLVAFGLLYQQWFPEVFDFVARVVRNRRMAEEITEEAFVLVVDQLETITDQTRVLVRLFSIAHELANTHRATGRLEINVDGVSFAADPEFASLIWEGTALLGGRTYALVDLSVRRGLNPAEVGAAAGIREDMAVETVRRTKDRAAHAVSIFVLVKMRVPECPGLRGIVGAHARDSLGTDLSEVVGIHIQLCPGCDRAWRQRPSPLEVLRRLPLVTAAPGVRDRIWSRIRRRYRWTGPGSTTRRMRAALLAACVGVVLATSTIVGLGADRPAGTDLAVPASPNLEAISRDFIPAEREAVVATATSESATTTSVGEKAPVPDDRTSTTLIPSEPPVLMIITPVMGQRFTSSSGLGIIELVAVVQDDIDDRLTVNWRSGSTHLASGNSVSVPMSAGCPEPQSYSITATATDSSGGSTSETVTFSVACADQGG